MSDADDPVRLLDDPGTSSELRSLLVAGRSDALDRGAVVRVQARVHDRLAAPAVSRRWWGIGAGTAVVIGWLALRSPASDAAREPAPVAPASIAMREEPPAAVPARLVAPPPVSATAPIATPPIDRPAARARPRESRRAAVPAAAPASASEEARLLLAARRALASDPTAALARTAEHERRFANGTLVEERELVAVRALVALDRKADAQARADRFVERFPDSVHRPALERALQ